MGEMVRGSRRLSLVVVLVAGLWAAAPVASAMAASRYVDDTGTGAAPCTNQNLPCPTIATALTAAASGDVIHVGGGNYPVNVSLPNGISLIKDSFASVPPVNTLGLATINATGNANPAVAVAAGMAPRTISGFTLRGGNSVGQSALQVATSTDNVTISGNTFDDHSASVAVQLRISSGSPLVTGNTFLGASDNVTRFAIGYSTGTAGSPEIANNTISNFFQGIQIVGASPNTFNVHGNTIALIHEAQMAIPVGIDVSNGSGSITGNSITSASSPTNGIGTLIDTGSSVVPLELTGNQIYGFPEGAEVAGSVPVTMNDDLLANNGFALFDLSTDTLTATNLTTSSTGTFYEITLGAGASLALNSSFVGAAGAGVAGGGTCTSSFSVTTHAPICGMSQIADPLFVNAAANNFHLQAGSPLIDLGDPATPASATDLAGNPRALAIHVCPARRDIGAYEFATNPLDCTPPAGPPASVIPPGTVPTSPTGPTKKCKKKHRSASAAKKKHCKKKRR
jgi:hypothetical protein